MICLPIMASSNAEAEKLLSLAASEPADMYELRFDRIDGTPDVEGLIERADRPVIATCRSAAQGGLFTGTVEERAAILRRAIDAGADYVDAEEDVLPVLERKDGVKIIASWHNFYETPDNLDMIVDRLAALPCDWIKFAVMAETPEDGMTVLNAIARAVPRCGKPVIGIAMGEMGLASRVLGPAYGSQITFGALSAGRESAPGQPGARDLAEVYRVDRITRDTAVYGLLGDPVNQSLGYRIHNRAFAMTGVDAVYIPMLCHEVREFPDALADAMNVRGLSVTMPHKQAMLSRAGRISEAVKGAGAVNTLVRANGEWDADNTDFHAVVSAVGDAAREHEVTLRNAPALVLGGGGAARAIGAALAAFGCDVHVTGRSEELIRELASEMQWTPVDWDDRENGEWMVVANATPVGMQPDIDSTPFAQSGWRKGTIAFDAVYRPNVTRFLREAEAAGAWTVDGLEMFTRQAAIQFRLWTGRTMPAECVRSVIG